MSQAAPIIDRRIRWRDPRLLRLRAGWAAGESRASLGRALHVTPDAVGKKAHQMNLAARPSPIPVAHLPVRAAPRTLRGAATLPPLGCCTAPADPAKPEESR
jgi:hypothetical protein